MRRFFASIAGNASLCRRLESELSEGSLSHAYIIEGPAGSGKKTLANALVMALACENRNTPASPVPCGHCPSCRKIGEGKSPDVLTVERPQGKTFLSVDTVRELRRDIGLVPNDLDFKVYIIPDAHTMNVQAQNAFLLTLEEPPPFVLFLLLAEDAGALLETIRSRAPILRMQPVSDAEMTDFLLSPDRPQLLARAANELKQKNPAEFDALLRIADGRIGVALDLLDEGKRKPLLERRDAATALCRLLAARTRSAELYSAITDLGTTREQACEQLSLLKLALRDLLLLTLEENAPLLFFTDREDALQLSERFSTARLLSLQRSLDKAISALEENANLRLTLTQLLNSIA